MREGVDDVHHQHLSRRLADRWVHGRPLSGMDKRRACAALRRIVVSLSRLSAAGPQRDGGAATHSALDKHGMERCIGGGGGGWEMSIPRSILSRCTGGGGVDKQHSAEWPSARCGSAVSSSATGSIYAQPPQQTQQCEARCTAAQCTTRPKAKRRKMQLFILLHSFFPCSAAAAAFFSSMDFFLLLLLLLAIMRPPFRPHCV